MYDILERFKKKFKHLEKEGLRVEGISMINPVKKQHAIRISRPLMFDSRKIPDRFEGILVKRSISLNIDDLPDEFIIDRTDPDWSKKEYIWAPERFEKFVDRCTDLIRTTLGDPEMSREEMLDAICFGSFEAHKEKVARLIEEGKVPAYKEK